MLIIPRERMPGGTVPDEGFTVVPAPCPWLSCVESLKQWGKCLGDGAARFFFGWGLSVARCMLLTVSLLLTAMKVIYRKRQKFDLVYAHNQRAALAGLLIGLMHRVPNVTRLYGTFLADLLKKPLRQPKSALSA